MPKHSTESPPIPNARKVTKLQGKHRGVRAVQDKEDADKKRRELVTKMKGQSKPE
jgi:hypothetical protein